MEKVKKAIKSNKIPFVVLFLIMLVLTYFKKLFRDDIYFGDFSNLTGVPRLLMFVEWRFFNWTSRFIIETVLILFTRDFVWLWKILDPILYVILAYGISRVFLIKNKDNKYMNTIIVCLILFIPQILISTAGWIATSLNYLWTTAPGIIGLIPIRKSIDGEKIRWFEIPVYFGCLLFACNVEQVAAVLFTAYVIFSIYLIVKKKINLTIIIMLLVTVASVILVLWSPGNANRTVSEIAMHFHDYPMFNIIDKLLVGFYGAMQYYINVFNPIYVMFTFLIMQTVFKKYNNWFYRIISIFPFFMGIAFNIFGSFSSAFFGDLVWAFRSFAEEYKILINLDSFTSVRNYIPIFLSIVNLGLLLISTYLVFGNNKKGILAFIVLSAGICSKIMMGFVVTVFVSGIRTHFLFIITMIILTIMILDERDDINLRSLSGILIILTIFRVISNFCLIVALDS